MASKKPQRRIPASTPGKEAPATLMGNQDVKRKGDTGGNRKSAQMTFWVTPARKAEIAAYAAAHEMSVSRLIIEGLEMRMRQE